MKCIILGDSISEGIGSKKINYEEYLKQYYTKNNMEIINFAKTGTTIKYPLDNIDKIKEENADIIIIMYGNVDAQIRPNLNLNKYHICDFIPNRYKKGGMLDPRAFYSKKWYRFIPDRLDNILRFFIKKIVLITQGKIQWMKIDDFYKNYLMLLNELINGKCQIVLVSTVYIDDKYFLDSNKEYIKYNKKIKQLSKEKCLEYVNIYDDLKNIVKKNGWNMYYSYDHFHPNKYGLKYIGKKIAKKIK